MAVTASSVRSRWGIPATIDDDLLSALITEAEGTYRSATGETGLTALAAHLALDRLKSTGGAGGRAVVSASHNAASKSLEAAALFTPRSSTEAWYRGTPAGTYYWSLCQQHPLSFIVTP
jgi:hypothetical protein